MTPNAKQTAWRMRQDGSLGPIVRFIGDASPPISRKPTSLSATPTTRAISCGANVKSAGIIDDSFWQCPERLKVHDRVEKRLRDQA